jgi:hypothetical protein
MERQGGADQGRPVPPVGPAIHTVELGQVPERERPDPVPIGLLARSTRRLLKAVHGARRGRPETQGEVKALGLPGRIEPDYPSPTRAEVQDGPGRKPVAEPHPAVAVADGEVAQNADPPERHGADHPG